MTYDLGDTVPLGVEVRDSAGTLVDAGGVVLTITLPDGSSLTPATQHVSVGRYAYDYVPTVAGRYGVRWTTTAPATGYSDAFDVQAADMGFLVSLATAKEALNIPLTNTDNDEEIRRVLATASSQVEKITGPVLRRDYVEVLDGGGFALVLKHPPVLTLTSITGLGLAPGGYLSTDWRLYPDSGVVRLVSGGCFASGALTVSYTAGRVSVPYDLQDACLIILDHLWQTQRGWSAVPTVRGESAPAEGGPPMGFALPNRALQLLEPFRQAVVA